MAKNGMAESQSTRNACLAACSSAGFLLLLSTAAYSQIGVSPSASAPIAQAGAAVVLPTTRPFTRILIGNTTQGVTQGSVQLKLERLAAGCLAPEQGQPVGLDARLLDRGAFTDGEILSVEYKPAIRCWTLYHSMTEGLCGQQDAACQASWPKVAFVPRYAKTSLLLRLRADLPSTAQSNADCPAVPMFAIAPVCEGNGLIFDEGQAPVQFDEPAPGVRGLAFAIGSGPTGSRCLTTQLVARDRYASTGLPFPFQPQYYCRGGGLVREIPISFEVWSAPN